MLTNAHYVTLDTVAVMLSRLFYFHNADILSQIIHWGDIVWLFGSAWKNKAGVMKVFIMDMDTQKNTTGVHGVHGVSVRACCCRQVEKREWDKWGKSIFWAQKLVNGSIRAESSVTNPSSDSALCSSSRAPRLSAASSSVPSHSVVKRTVPKHSAERYSQSIKTIKHQLTKARFTWFLVCFFLFR